MSGSKTSPPVLGRDRAIVLGGLAGVVACAWLYLFYLADGMSGGMAESGQSAMAMVHAQPWDAGDTLAMMVMWVVMMVGMMLPSAAPMILLYAGISRKHRAAGRPYPSAAVFTGGYMAAWTGFSVAATAVQWALHGLLLLSPMMTTTSPLLGAGVLVGAGLYQFTPLKGACLRHCRSPLAFLMTRWRDGSRGAFLMGLEHGAYCLGCCWVLMLVLFVVGVMNLLWVAAITLFVLLEKLAPRGDRWSHLAGIALMAAGAGVAIFG